VLEILDVDKYSELHQQNLGHKTRLDFIGIYRGISPIPMHRIWGSFRTCKAKSLN